MANVNHTNNEYRYRQTLITAVHWTLFFCLVCPGFASEEIILRASATPQEAWIGQRVNLHIDILGKDGWAKIEKIGDFEIADAFVMRRESQGTRLQETIKGSSYTGQQYEVMIYPQRAGRIEIPEISTTVTIKSWGNEATESVRQMKTPATSLICKRPPGAEGIDGLISSTQLTANQTWTRQSDAVKVGDTIKRMITLKAEDVSGMAFTPANYPKIEGVGIYPGEPTVKDEFNRGLMTGSRTENVTYVFENPGRITIPDIMLTWWDVSALKLKQIKLPGLTLLVTGTPVKQPRQDPQNAVRWLILTALTISVIALFCLRKRIRVCWTVWQKARTNSETVYFRRVMKSGKSGDSKAILHETMRWLDRLNDDPKPARLDLFLSQYGDARSQEAAMSLTSSLVSDTKCQDIAAFLKGLVLARNRWKKSQRAKKKAPNLLPELNC